MLGEAILSIIDRCPLFGEIYYRKATFWCSESCSLFGVSFNDIPLYGFDYSIPLAGNPITMLKSIMLCVYYYPQVGGLLQDWRRVNVALTRARHKLVMVGSSHTLCHAPLLARLLALLQERGWVLNLQVGVTSLSPAVNITLPKRSRFTVAWPACLCCLDVTSPFLCYI